MTTRRFLSQQQLVNWSDEGKIDVQGEKMVVVAEQLGVTIREAVRFMKLVSGEDSQGLLAKVKTVEQVKELGAEHYLDSVILGETAYEVQQGYVAEMAGAAPGPRAGSHGSAPAARSNGPDADALARFILGKV
jgi:hypothetical protein